MKNVDSESVTSRVSNMYVENFFASSEDSRFSNEEDVKMTLTVQLVRLIFSVHVYF
jgi:hypothetical protein